MNPNYREIKEHLQKNNYRLTKQRKLILERILSNAPITSTELCRLCMPDCDRATVYRTISIFEKIGIILRITLGWKYKLELSDQFLGHHHHMTCLSCGKSFDLKDLDPIEKNLIELSKKHNFQIISHQLEISGYCKDCNKKIREHVSDH
jgi:Fe2+ or Zn2+ uptake regulation protein